MTFDSGSAEARRRFGGKRSQGFTEALSAGDSGDVLIFVFVTCTEKPAERTASAEADRPPPSAKPLPSEDLFGSSPFVANAGKS